MEYISAKEFLKQPKEVQEVFIEWWKPSIGDLYDYYYEEINDYGEGTENYTLWRHDKVNKTCVINEFCMCRNGIKNNKEDILEIISEGAINITPLLAEGQLRKFIEDKVGYMDITLNDIADNSGNKNYEIECYPYILFEGFGDSKVFNIWADNLLQAYWKVAVQIAKESKASTCQ